MGDTAVGFAATRLNPTLYCNSVVAVLGLARAERPDAVPTLKRKACFVDVAPAFPSYSCEKSDSIFGPARPAARIHKVDCARILR
jgi:hypothetical protein